MWGGVHQPCLVVLGGATATGKTGLSLALARRLRVAILSADSRLVYRELDIGTAKPTVKERSQAPHYCIDIRNPTETMTVADYQQEANTLIQTLHDNRERLPLLVGGTGLYISSIVDGLRIPPVAPQAALRSQLLQLGQTQCHAMLQHIDPTAAQRIHPNDSVRTVRALEVAYVTGQPLSVQQGRQPPNYPVLYLGLDCETDFLKKRIEQRTAQMMEQGLVSEVETLCRQYGPDLPLLKTLGYAEMLGYLAGDYSIAEATALIVKSTCQFAKRQRTWFRKQPIRWFDAAAIDVVEQVWDAVQTFLTALPTVKI
ncbi:tRNA (adenosine(37)-N6)-dimethylallyltransferase MiaA [Oscillatoria sp. CS-180]|uniref:tRNA (adenosine(37)-N6)-dimethylallyltransferase MiaA n=1 Tax=Oscillatoria sp. CS-180 TaxID=3021720 RepID=UPI00232AEF70|nr:tRNA (adenosine(37)-N6)-dimethylallyltransferase MiaA [Oscillatoria sp. CS-180]MDB9525744.1 tRNA (adenosine(37)-N6)-dimethylallyltransferase MiaA [Oscillatoria sp. CS-180]